MFPSYIFHKESQEEFKNFLTAAAELHATTTNHSALISDYLEQFKSQQQPQNTSQHDLNKSTCSQNDEDVIILNSQPDLQTRKSPENDILYQEIVQSFNYNLTTPVDLIDTISENLRTEKAISQSDLKEFASTYSGEQIENFMRQIQAELDVNAVINFGMVISNCELENIKMVSLFFYEHILFPLLSTEQSLDFQKMFNCVYKKFHKIIKDNIVKNLLQTSCSRIFLINISKLDGELKSDIMWHLVVNCRQLEQIHVKVLDCLLDKNTHHSVIKAIITLLASQGETSDKATGKLIVSLMQILGRNINHFEQQLRQIIAKHKSLLRATMQKTFDMNYECSQLSQSLIRQ